MQLGQFNTEVNKSTSLNITWDRARSVFEGYGVSNILVFTSNQINQIHVDKAVLRMKTGTFSELLI